MKIIRNEKLIKRNSKIGKWASLAGLIIVSGSLFYSVPFITNPETAENQSLPIILAILFISLALTQVGMYFGSRFGRRPRPDELLDTALKGLPGDYSLYHYSTVVPHLLIGPAGIWILMPFHQRGKVAFVNNRWKAGGGGFLQGYLRIFGQESLGRPELEATHRVNALEKFLKDDSRSETSANISAVLVFLDANIEIQAEAAPIPALQVKKLKDFIRKTAKDSPLSSQDVEEIKAILPKR